MYEALWTGYIRRLSDDAQIPPSPDNRDYQDYLAWVKAGNSAAIVAKPADPPDPNAALKAALDAAEADLALGTAAGVRSAVSRLVTALKARPDRVEAR